MARITVARRAARIKNPYKHYVMGKIHRVKGPYIDMWIGHLDSPGMVVHVFGQAYRAGYLAAIRADARAGRRK